MCEWCYVAPLLFMHPIHGSQGPQRANSCRQADMLRTSATSLEPTLPSRSTGWQRLLSVAAVT